MPCTINGAPGFCTTVNGSGGNGGAGGGIGGGGNGPQLCSLVRFGGFVHPELRPCGSSGGGGGGGSAASQTTKLNSPLNKPGCGSQRLALLVKGALNFGVGYAKIGVAAGSVAALPFTGGVSAVGVAYGAIGAAGNISAGGIDLIGALTGRVADANELAGAASTVTTVSGLVTLTATGNMEAAGTAANFESLGTAGFNGGATGNLIDEGANAVQKFLLSTELGQNLFDAAGLGELNGCQ